MRTIQTSNRLLKSEQAAAIGVPLFPGYLFCRFDPLDRLVPVLSTPGVSRIVSAGKAPIPVAGEEMEAVSRIVQSGIAAEPWPFLSAGCHVAIEHGPLAGLDGILTGAAGGHRLVVSVSLLQRSVAVQVDREWVRATSDTARPGLVHKAAVYAI